MPSTTIGFNLRGQGSSALELDLFEGIGGDPLFGGGITAQSVLDALNENKNAKSVLVRINSAGGIVTEGLAIYNLLRSHRAEVTCRVDGLAGSIASVIAMAGRLEMPTTSYLMIHNPWGWVEGGADDLRHQADVLESMRSMMLDIYCAKSGKGRDFIGAMMDEEKWMTGTEALAYGLCDALIPAPNAKLAAHCDLSRYRNTPRSLDTARTIEPVAAVIEMVKPITVETQETSAPVATENEPPPAAEKPPEKAADNTAAPGASPMDEQAYKDKIAELEGANATLKAELDGAKSDVAKAEVDAAEAKAKFTKKGDDDDDDDDEESNAKASVIAACVELTGEKDLVRLEGAVMALGPRLQGAANAKAAREIEVSGLIAKGRLLPAQKKWALNCKPEALAAYLESIGSVKVGPVGEEHTPDEGHESVLAARESTKAPSAKFDSEKVQLTADEKAACKIMGGTDKAANEAAYLADKRARAQIAFDAARAS
jgi:ATP-dependent Clp endopeptidase proteolytic subunit ClpP